MELHDWFLEVFVSPFLETETVKDAFKLVVFRIIDRFLAYLYYRVVNSVAPYLLLGLVDTY